MSRTMNEIKWRKIFLVTMMFFAAILVFRYKVNAAGVPTQVGTQIHTGKTAWQG